MQTTSQVVAITGKDRYPVDLHNDEPLDAYQMVKVHDSSNEPPGYIKGSGSYVALRLHRFIKKGQKRSPAKMANGSDRAERKAKERKAKDRNPNANPNSNPNSPSMEDRGEGGAGDGDIDVEGDSDDAATCKIN
jgi:hypothetical protein